jgi:myo-inositol-1(or 4)-monophosphatase
VTVDPADLRSLAADVAAEAAAGLLDILPRTDLLVETKTSSTDMVTETDRAVERAIVSSLLAARPGDGILGEEGAARAGTSGVRWVIDPIDGTTNFLYGLPGFNVSVAAEVDGVVVAGAVADPLHGDVFSAHLGGGATRNDRPVRCTEGADVAAALVATGFSYEPDRRRRQAEVLTRVLPVVRDIRRVGAAAVDLCWVGCGRVDACYEKGLQRWDWAAGAIVATEAGATVGDLDGGPPSFAFTLAATPALFDPLAALLREAGAAEA